MSLPPPPPAPPPELPELPGRPGRPPIPPPPEPPERSPIPPPDEAIRSRPSRAPLVVGALALVMLVAGAMLMWRWLTTPAPCAGADLSSERFGYCIAVPRGWLVARVTGEALPADQLFKPDGDATVTIQAVETARGLDAFAEDLRRLQRDAGLEPAETRSIRVNGVSARQWDAAVVSGPQAIRTRTVVFERDGVAWQVQFADAEEAFDQDVGDLSRILESWRFR